MLTESLWCSLFAFSDLCSVFQHLSFLAVCISLPSPKFAFQYLTLQDLFTGFCSGLPAFHVVSRTLSLGMWRRLRLTWRSVEQHWHPVAFSGNHKLKFLVLKYGYTEGLQFFHLISESEWKLLIKIRYVEDPSAEARQVQRVLRLCKSLVLLDFTRELNCQETCFPLSAKIVLSEILLCHYWVLCLIYWD